MLMALLSKRKNAFSFLMEFDWENPSSPIVLTGSVGIDKLGDTKENKPEDMKTLKGAFTSLDYKFPRDEELPTAQELSKVITQFQVDHFGPQTDASNYGWMSMTDSNTLKRLNEVYVSIDKNVGGAKPEQGINPANETKDFDVVRGALTGFGYTIKPGYDADATQSLSDALLSFQTTEFGIRDKDWKLYGWAGAGGGTMDRINRNRNQLRFKYPRWKYIDYDHTKSLPMQLMPEIANSSIARAHAAAVKAGGIPTQADVLPTIDFQQLKINASGDAKYMEVVLKHDINNPDRIVPANLVEIDAAIKELNGADLSQLKGTGYRIKVPTEYYWLGKDLEFYQVSDQKKDTQIENVDKSDTEVKGDTEVKQDTEVKTETTTTDTNGQVIGPAFKELTYKASKVNVKEKLTKTAEAPLIIITDTVGGPNKGVASANKPEELSAVQNALIELGYKITLPDTDLTMTTKAIKDFQTAEFGSDKASGYMGPGRDTISRLNEKLKTKRSALTPEQIAANRKNDFTVTVTRPGENIPVLTATVGQTDKPNRNYKSDAVTIMGVLDTLGMYDQAEVSGKNKTNEINAATNSTKKYLEQADVKYMIAAIKALQKLWKIDRLVNEESDKTQLYSFGMSKDLSDPMIEGTIQQNDATYVMLKNYKRNDITYTDYKGDKESFRLGNFKYFNTSAEGKSRKRSMKDAYQMTGDLKFNVNTDNIDTAIFEHAGLSKKEGKALMWVSQNEGGLDALNTYDRQIISVGFSQLAGEGAFEKYLAYIKFREPQLFFEYFQKYGIDVEYTMAGGEIADGETLKLKVFDLDTNTWKTDIGKWASGTLDAKKEIRENPVLLAAFVRASQDPRIQTIQIETTYRHYVEAAYNISVKITSLNDSIKLKELITSEIGLAGLFDYVIHRWTDGPTENYNKVYNDLFVKNKYKTISDLKKLNELDVINAMIPFLSGDGMIKGRMENLTAKMKTDNTKFKNHKLTSDK